MNNVRYFSLLAVSATLLTFSSCTKDAKEDMVSESNISVAHATAASCGTSDSIRTVFISFGNSSNGIWGLNATGAQVASERNYNPNGTVLDRVENPMIYGNTGNLPCDLLNFTAVGGNPHWFGGRHQIGVSDDAISGSESLTVTLGSGLTNRRASSAVMNLAGTATAATVQLLLNGSPVGAPQTVTLGNAKTVNAGVLFNGFRISAASGSVSIKGSAGAPRQAIQFNLVAATPACAVNAVRVFLSMGHSSNGIWGHNAAGALVTSERNYNPNGTVLDGVVNPMIYGNTGNLPCDLLNFTAVGGTPNWFGGRQQIGVGDDAISGSESLTVTLGAGFTGRAAISAKANLTGTATAATVQPLLNGTPVGMPLSVALGNAKPINPGVIFNGLRISAASGNVAIVGTAGRPREAIEFNLAQ